ncbi:MAG: hypothetical protein KatS3mg022_0492 [Armatimonadota bacterium]|nr:MAG: hypothetical protein KatS3mg022_0492 [Armatimonadota bacterium]
MSILWGPFPGKTEWPNYASGTRCEVVAHFYTNTPNAYLTRVKLRMGSETLIDQSLLYPMPYVYLNIRFASTHFPDDTHLEIYAEGTDSAGQTGSASRYVQVYNKATLYGRNEWENDPSAPTAGVPPSLEYLAYMNHNVSHTCVALGWTKQMVLNDIEPCTVFYVNTHGNVGVFISDSDELTGVIEEILPGDVLPVRQAAVGTGYPPFNTGLPPINLVFIDACLTGTDNSFNVFLWPYYNGYDTNWCENQAVVGWNISVDSRKTQACAAAFWSGLADGLTAHQARNQMVEEYFSPEPVPGPWRDYASVWGDYYTRLSGAYTGSDVYAPHFWW